jgi:hypothetical protein
MSSKKWAIRGNAPIQGGRGMQNSGSGELYEPNHRKAFNSNIEYNYEAKTIRGGARWLVIVLGRIVEI